MNPITIKAVKYFKKSDVENLDEFEVFYFLTSLKEKELIEWDIVMNDDAYELFKDEFSMIVDVLPKTLEKLLSFIENINTKFKNECKIPNLQN